MRTRREWRLRRAERERMKGSELRGETKRESMHINTTLRRVVDLLRVPALLIAPSDARCVHRGRGRYTQADSPSIAEQVGWAEWARWGGLD